MLGIRPTRRHRSAFTLVEILCVVVILGIASAIIIPQLGSRDDLRAAAAARTIMADLIYAQNTAIAQQRRHFVQFVGQQYTVLSRANDSSPLVTVTHPVTKNSYTVTFGTAINGTENVTLGTPDFGGGSAILGYDDLGAPFAYDAGTNTSTPLVSAGNITVTCGSTTLTIAVEPYTGETVVN
jgi:prepilin-type N-terminal cleavage/methylation domain-containing protein